MSKQSKELAGYVKSKYTKKAEKTAIQEMMTRQKIKTTIEEMLEEYLKEVGQVFTFEVSPNDLKYIPVVLSDEPLVSTYDFIQINESMFSAKLKEIEF